MGARRRILFMAAAVATLSPGPDGARAQSTGVVTGVVYDSLSRSPLADAAVFLWQTTHRGVTDDEGRFRIEGIPSGDYNILFFHTRLGEMGVSPGPRPVEVSAASETDVRLATPSLGTFVTSQCLMEDTPPDVAVVAGWVRDQESDMLLGGSEVTLAWTAADSPEVGGLLRMTVSPGGWYYTCLAPVGRPLLAGASYYGRESARREITLPDDGFTEATFALQAYDPSELHGRLIDAVSGRSVEGARVWLRGTSHQTLTDGRGRFDLGEVIPGEYMLVADHLGYGLKMAELEVPGGTRLAAEMRVDSRPLELAPVAVTVDAPEPISASMGGGIRITSDQIEEVRQRSRDASDVLRSLHIPGVIVRHRSDGSICVGYITGQVKMNQSGCVEMLVFINDVRATNSDLALRIPPDGIERMTIYKPVEAGNLFGVGGGNGVWMIYTKGN